MNKKPRATREPGAYSLLVESTKGVWPADRLMNARTGEWFQVNQVSNEGPRLTVKDVPPKGRAPAGPKKEVSGSGTNRAQAPKKKPFRLEVGKTYRSANGRQVTIRAKDPDGSFTNSTSRFVGCIWKRDGSPWYPNMDTARLYGSLIREVKSPKRSAQAKPKPSQSHPQPRRKA